MLAQYTKGKTVKELVSEAEKAQANELAKQAAWDSEKSRENSQSVNSARGRTERTKDARRSAVPACSPGSGLMRFPHEVSNTPGRVS